VVVIASLGLGREGEDVWAWDRDGSGCGRLRKVAGGWARSFQRSVMSLSFKSGTSGEERSMDDRKAIISSS
jgi:hypothetical protein